MRTKRTAVIMGLLLGCLASGRLVADIPFFWLDKPAGRSNPNDPRSPRYVAPTPIFPTNTPSPFAVFTLTPTPSRTSTPSPSASPSPAGTFTAPPTHSPTPSASPTRTPASCLSTYSFEPGLEGWARLVAGPDVAFTSISGSSAQSVCGNSVALGVDLRHDMGYEGGQVSVSAGFPMDFSCKLVTAWIWVPAGMSDAGNPAGAFLFAKTGPSSNWVQGAWTNLPNAGGWTQLSFNTNGVPDANDVQTLGVKVALGGSSSPYNGTIYLDEVNIAAVACATATDTPTPGAMVTDTPTPTRTPTPVCPLMPYAGLSRDWFNGDGSTFDISSAGGFGAPWDTDISSATVAPHSGGRHLQVNLAWSGFFGGEGYNWAGWYEPNAMAPYARAVSRSHWDSFEFWVRGAVGGEDHIGIRLVEAVSTTASNLVNINEILGGPLSTSYQKVVLPLCLFSFADGDPEKIWEVNFEVSTASDVATDTGSMSFYVDDGRFVKYQASPPSPTSTPTVTPTPNGCALPSGSPVVEEAWWSGMPPAAQVWAGPDTTAYTQDTANPKTPGNLHMVWTLDMIPWWAGGSINFSNWGTEVDSTQYDTLEFWIRGAAGGEPVTVSMGFTGNDGASAGTPMISLAPYMSSITTTYQLVRVPLCAFDFITNGNDPTKVWQMDLQFACAANAIYTLYVDEVYFRKY